MERHALIAGVSGIIGRHLAEHLSETKGWKVTGISRHKHDLPKGVKHIAVDLTDDEAVHVALKRMKPTDVFITTWMRQTTEAENCRVLMDWNIEVDEAMFLGGLAKGEFLREFEPDFFFDDQTGHIESAAQHVPSGHVASGVSNPDN